MCRDILLACLFFFFQAEDGIRDHCVTGVQTCALPICTGGDLAVVGGPSTYSSWLTPLGATEHYVQPASLIYDPLASVLPPSTTGLPTNPAVVSVTANNFGCPAVPLQPCMLYSPGIYTS